MSSRRGRASRRKRRFFITAIIAIAIAEVGFIVAYLGPVLMNRSQTAQFNALSLIAFSLVNITSYETTPSLMNPLVFNGTKPILIYITLAPATTCTIPYGLLYNASRMANVILVFLNQPSVALQYITPMQWVNVLNSMEVLNCTAPPGVYLATASWISKGSQLPLGIFNATQLMHILNSTAVLNAVYSGYVTTILPLAIVARGNGTVAGYLMGFEATNYTLIKGLLAEASS